MNTLLCPYCQTAIPLFDATQSKFLIFFHNKERNNSQLNSMDVEVIHCPTCDKEIVRAIGKKGPFAQVNRMIYPPCICNHYPEYIPLQIRQDYEEASAILHDSPKSAATLARRCLQGMIRDFWGISDNRLVDAIQKLKDKVPVPQWQAIDSIRSLGNIGAHMEKDVNLIIDIDKGEAQQLINLIELLIKQWYLDRHDADELCKNVTAINQQKQTQRKNQT